MERTSRSAVVESGYVMHAMGKVFHPEHFCCALCRRALHTDAFYVVNHQPTCHSCYQVSQPIKCSMSVSICSLLAHTHTHTHTAYRKRFVPSVAHVANLSWVFP